MSDIAKKEKKQKKDKKRKHEETEEDAAPAVEPTMTDDAEEETPKEKKKKEKKAKKAKKEASDADEDEQANSKPSSGTSNALSDLADELVVSKSAHGAAADDEPIDLLALKKNKKAGANVHPSRMSGAEKADAAAADGEKAAFVPDENAIVIAEPVRIFVGNLPFKITDALIHECFDEFGAIDGIHWVTDKATGQFYGTGFVDFEKPESAKAALVRNGVEILGRAIKVNMATGANVAGKNRFNSKQKNGGHLAQLPVSAKPDGCNTVFLGNLPFTIDEATLREVFDPCGVITDIRWVEKDGEFKGCGFIEFEESWSTDEAIKLNGSDALGRPMRVDYSARSSR